MTPEQAEIGTRVLYRAHPDARAELGRISSTQALATQGIVHVLYDGDGTPKPTRLVDLVRVTDTRQTPAVLRGATALGKRHRLAGSSFDLDNLPPGERLWWIGSAHDAMVGAVDVDEMAQAYGVAQFGRQGWDDAPAVIRNDVREHMGAVVAMILGETK